MVLWQLVPAYVSARLSDDSPFEKKSAYDHSVASFYTPLAEFSLVDFLRILHVRIRRRYKAS